MGPALGFSCEQPATESLPVSLYPCSMCGARPQGKLASTTWAWNLADGKRVAWRQRLCTQCFILHVQSIPLLPSDAPLACPNCGISTAEDMDPVYCTAFVPGVGKYSLEWPFCGACAVTVRAAAQENAQRLESGDDSSGAGGSGPRTSSPQSDWAALGIQPR
jgi:hypothetical protein